MQSIMLNKIVRMSEHMTEQMALIRMGISSMKTIFSQRVAATATVKNKKQPHINDFEDMLAKNLPRFKNAFRKATFSPVLFGQIAQIIVKTYMPESVGIGRMKRVMDLFDGMGIPSGGSSLFSMDFPTGSCTHTKCVSIRNYIDLPSTQFPIGSVLKPFFQIVVQLSPV